ncbi:unnamed protein product, partial [Symbiodinium microadriaticum]
GMVVAARFPTKPAAGVASPEVVLPAARLGPAATLQPPSEKQEPATPPPVVAKNGGIHPLPNVVKAPTASAAVVGVVPPRFVAASKEAEEEPQAKRQKLESQETAVAAPAGCSGDGGQVASQPDADPTTNLHQELEKLRRENAALRSKASTSSMPPVAGDKPQVERETAESTVVTKGQIKRMKLEAKEVLYRPIQEGFGFKMLQKFGWKEGEGLGKHEKGLATPLWADPREGRSGLYSAQMGESRPPRPADEEEDWMNPKPLAANPLRFVSEGTPVEKPPAVSSPKIPGFVPARNSGNGMPGWVAPRQPPTRARPRPSISAVAPALLGLLSDQQWQTRSGNSGAAVLGELLAEALQGEAGDRFLRLVDERLGPEVAPHIAQLQRARPEIQDPSMQPLWQLTQHHMMEQEEAD